MATVPTVAVLAALLAVFDPALRLARLAGIRPMDRVAAALHHSLLAVLRLTGMSLQVERDEAVSSVRGCIVVSNHQSMLDISLCGALLGELRPRFVAKASLEKWIPSVSFFLRRGGNAIIVREDPRQSLRAIREAGRFVAEHQLAAVIFPEGTRSRSGELGQFQGAGVLTLMRAAPHLPLLPVAIDGSADMFRDNLLPIPLRGRVRFRAAAPIPRSPGDDPQQLLARARDEIVTTLETWRGNPV